MSDPSATICCEDFQEIIEVHQILRIEFLSIEALKKDMNGGFFGPGLLKPPSSIFAPFSNNSVTLLLCSAYT